MKKRKAVVIGAGLGGISAAISLAANDFEVAIFEKNKHVGGKLNLQQKEGFEFDLGPSILTMPYLFENLFHIHNKKMEDYVQLEHVHPHWRCFFPDGKKRDIDTALLEADSLNHDFTNQDITDLKSFMHYAEQIFNFADHGYFKGAADNMMQLLRKTKPLKLLKDSDFAHTLDQGISTRVADFYLREILRFFIKYVGSSPYDAPAILNLLPYIQFKMGLWYVTGGMYNLALGLEKLMNESGVEIYKETEVTEINTSNSTVKSVICADGKTFDADVIVSNMEFIPAYRELLNVDEAVLEKEEKKFEAACSGLALHLGVNKVYEELAHHNVFFSNDSQHFYQQIFHQKVLPDDPSIYLVAPKVTDNRVAPPQCSVIKVLPHIPHLVDSPPQKEDYLKLRARVLDKLEQMGLKDLRQHIVVEEMWTPHEIKANYYSNRGAIYGVVSNRKMNIGFKGPKKSKYFKGLYFVGGSVNPGGGMPMVILSGQQVAEIIKKDLF